MKNVILISLLAFATLTMSQVQASPAQPWCHTNWVGGTCGTKLYPGEGGQGSAHVPPPCKGEDCPKHDDDEDDEDETDGKKS